MHFWKTLSVSEEGFMELSPLGLCWSWNKISALNNLCQPRTAGVLLQAEPQLTWGRCHGVLELGESLLVLTQMQNRKRLCNSKNHPNLKGKKFFAGFLSFLGPL